MLGWNLTTWAMALAVGLGTIAVVNRSPARGLVKPNE